MYNLTDSPLYTEIKHTSTPRNPIRATGSFFLLLILSTMISSVPLFIYMYGAIFSDPSAIGTILSGDPDALSLLMNRILFSDTATLLQLLFCAIPIAASLYFTYFLAHRRLSTMGFRKKHALLYALLGFLAGVLLLALSLAVAMLNQSVSVSPSNDPPVLMILLFLLGFLIQGAEEEILFRGVLFPALLETQTPILAISVNSLFFAFMHGGNSGVQPIAFLNIFLFGFLLSILMLRTGSIWAPMTLHAAWNFAEGCIFGSSVSGMPMMPSLLITLTSPEKTLTNGGAFGPEGGLAVTVVLILALIVLTLIPSKKKSEIPKI